MQIRRGIPTYEDVPREAAESFAARAFDEGRFPFNWHYHPEIELTLVPEGRGTRFVGDSIEAFGPGDCCLLGANLPHTWRSGEKSEPARSIVLQFLPGTWCAPLGGLPELRPVAALLERAGAGLSFGPETFGRCREVVEGVLESPVGSPARVAGLISALGILADAADARPLASAPAEASEVGHAVLTRVLEKLHAAPDGPPTQAEMAALTRRSPSAFSRLFARHMGKTYEQYANDWRLAHACRLLLETDQDITAIAFDSGFRNLSNFNRRFKAAKGMTPREYRKAFPQSG